jgi:hypothetical protein
MIAVDESKPKRGITGGIPIHATKGGTASTLRQAHLLKMEPDARIRCGSFVRHARKGQKVQS